MRQALSALMDDELDASEQARVVAAVGRDRELRQAWDSYHLIGDALRRATALDAGLTQQVMASLEREPALLVSPLRARPAVRAALALAATVAGVAVVAWLALPTLVPEAAPLKAQVAAKGAAQGAAATAAAAGAGAGSRMQEYMVAHQSYSPGNRMFGGTAYVRTVSAGADRRAR